LSDFERPPGSEVACIFSAVWDGIELVLVVRLESKEVDEKDPDQKEVVDVDVGVGVACN
jgi:hypothetical protein